MSSVEPFGKMKTPAEYRFSVQTFIQSEIDRLGKDHPNIKDLFAWADRHHPGWMEP